MRRAALGLAALAGAMGAAAGCAGTARPPGAAPAARTSPGPKQLQPRQIIVALAADAAEAPAVVTNALAAEYGLVEAGSFPLRSVGLVCVVFQVDEEGAIPAVLARLAVDPRVVLAERNEEFHGLAAGPGPGATPLAYAAALLRADEAHRTRTGRGVRVAIIDTGVATRHPALRGAVTTTQNFVEGGEPAFERDRHGTALAGVIGARGEAARVLGIAPGAELLALKACWYAAGDEARAVCSSWTLAKALDFAIGAGARVVNLSLGGPRDALLARLLSRARERGIVIVAAVAETGDGPGFPAGLPGVIAVVADDDRGRLAYPARVPAEVALAAPGVDILTTAPGDGWDFYSGTSLAAAHVTAVVALLLEERASLDGAGALAVLRRTARVSPGPGREPGREVGLVDACAALGSLRGLPSCP